MAKRPSNRPQKRLTFIDVIKGNFLNRDEVKIHYKYFMLVFLLMMIMIYSNHLVSQKIEMVNDLKEQTEEYKSRNAYAQSRLIKVKLESELGDVLFALINYARFLNINSEDALEKTNKKFIKRFQFLENKAKENGKALQDMTLAEMDIYWNEAKKI